MRIEFIWLWWFAKETIGEKRGVVVFGDFIHKNAVFACKIAF